VTGTIIIEIDTDPRNVPLDHPLRHKSYFKRTPDRGWIAYTRDMIPMALSNYTPNAAALSHALEDAADADEALTAVRNLVYRQYAEHAKIVKGAT
jgi:hypothetical protein